MSSPFDDPSVWTRPWTAKLEYSRQSEQQNRIYYEPRCVEGNYGHPALMLGARVKSSPMPRAVARTRPPRTTPLISSVWKRIRSSKDGSTMKSGRRRS